MTLYTLLSSSTSYTNATRVLTYFFFFNDTATTEIYTLSLHDALPISTISPWGSSTRGSRHRPAFPHPRSRSEEHTSELQSQSNLVCRLLLEKKKIDEASSHLRMKLTTTPDYLQELQIGSAPV